MSHAAIHGQTSRMEPSSVIVGLNIVLTFQVLLLTTALSFVARAGWSPEC